jgi:EAL domain-containing protein (putative c-di-GMP-specific phosphodiesterase class I)
MHVRGTVVGIVVGTTTTHRSADQLVGLLPAAVEYAIIASAVVGPKLASGVERSQARRDIEAIIEEGAFRAVYQPVCGLAAGNAVGFEALTRFGDGTPPDRRFAQAESVDLGPALELACLTEALRSADRLPGDGWLSLNVSPGLVLAGDELRRIIAHAGRPLVLELTEHSPVDDYQELRAAITRVGPDVRLAIDDAGAGFASFRHILELAPHFVKLDIGLVRGIDRDPARQALVAGMEYFASQTKATLIAEGIETADEKRALAKLRVSLGQGYLLGRPAPSDEWLEDRPSGRGPGAIRREGAAARTLSATSGRIAP